MNCPLHRTTVLGFAADSVGSGNRAADGRSGAIPAWPNRGVRSGLVGKRMYRLTETTPTA